MTWKHVVQWLGTTAIIVGGAVVFFTVVSRCEAESVQAREQTNQREIQALQVCVEAGGDPVHCKVSLQP